jgi:uncharacterized protein YjbI with pentapeptide repeats
MKRTSFDPAIHGFHFVNSFQNHRFIGPVHLDLSGRCGGMVYAAMDFYLNAMQIPAQNTLPAEGSVLSTYISARQDKSITNQLDLWIERVFNPFGWRTAEFFHWGLPSQLHGQVERLKSCIDIGKPAPLGLFAPGSGGFAPHHQVLAIGYEIGSHDQDLKIAIYDPNHPDHECIIRPQLDRYRFIETLPGGGLKEWLTYFVDLNYRPQRPNIANPCEHVTFRDWSGQDHRGHTYNNQDFRCSRFVSTVFLGCTMMQTDFSRSNAEQASFYGANIRNSNFSNVNLRKSMFYGADLKTATLVAADATKANFVGADLKTANLTSGIFESADFHGADMGGSICTSANFRFANCYGTDFSSANLDRADFTGAVLTGADFSHASKNGAIGLP